MENLQISFSCIRYILQIPSLALKLQKDTESFSKLKKFWVINNSNKKILGKSKEKKRVRGFSSSKRKRERKIIIFTIICKDYYHHILSKKKKRLLSSHHVLSEISSLPLEVPFFFEKTFRGTIAIQTIHIKIKIAMQTKRGYCKIGCTHWSTQPEHECMSMTSLEFLMQ
jgi:hypothetical protein